MSIIEKIKIIRAQTGISILECKKALIKNNLDISNSILHLRKIGILQAAVKSLRNASDGLIGVVINKSRKQCVIIEVNCETDFVSKSDDFQQYMECLCVYFMDNKDSKDNNYCYDNFTSNIQLEELRLNLIAKLGENIVLKMVKRISLENGFMFSYVHGGSKYGKIVSIINVSNYIDNDSALLLDISMQIVAMNPKYVSIDSVPLDILESEKKLNTNLTNFLKNNVLLNQVFIKNNEISVEDSINKKFTVLDFNRFEVGLN